MSIEQFYQDRIAHHAVDLQRLQESLRWLPWVRAACFLCFLALAAVALSAPSLNGVWAFLAAVSLIGLLVAAARHEQHERDVLRLRVLQKINQWGVARYRRQWSQLPEPLTPPATVDPTLDDLDILGHASLMELTCTAHTPLGRDCLAQWLSQRSPVTEIVRRQEAVRALASMSLLREQLQVEARLLMASHAGPQKLSAWAAAPCWFADKPLLNLLRSVTPWVAAALLAALALGVWQTAAGASLLAICLVHGVCNIGYVGQLNDIFNSVTTGAGEVQAYGRLFALARELPKENDLLREIREALSNRESTGRLHRLRRIMMLGEFRRGLTAPLYLIFQALFLWDFQIAALLDRWKTKHGQHVQLWFEALSRWEALCSLAALAHDHPAWCFPTFREGEPAGLWSKQLGHPLLAEQGRVCNNVELGPPGKFLLVTGSNMSGKSTLLRALGANIMLAQAGGPACAQQLQMTPLVVASSMRVRDSLEQGVSFFMAELKRLKQIVDLAQVCSQPDQPALCFLLDEILQGTNSKERHIAVTHILQKLSRLHTLGAVSTHDLELARQPELADSCRPVHFSETFTEDGGLVFRYELHEGVTTTTNALRLLRIVGLGDE